MQYVFDLKLSWATAEVLNQLEGNYGYLSMQKYSSNVIEQCLINAGEEHLSRIIEELINNSQLDQIMQDVYGNYVIQTALNHSKVDLRTKPIYSTSLSLQTVTNLLAIGIPVQGSGMALISFHRKKKKG